MLSLDEKSQIQALDRIQPGLLMKKGRCATMTHDYKRHGTTTLLAALDILEGTVIGRCICQTHPARLKRGVFTSIVELQTAINSFIAEANGKPKPFVWTNPLTPSSPLSSTGQILDCANARLSTQAM